MKQRSLAERQLIIDLNCAMDMMQADPELEEVDTLSVMEDVISDAIYFFTKKRRTTRDLEKKTTEKRIIATFHPQRWVGDTATPDETKATIDVDVTDKVLALGKEKALTLKDDSYETDDLVEHDHDGPFYVEVEDAIQQYFEE
jgi:hypothetical protein